MRLPDDDLRKHNREMVRVALPSDSPQVTFHYNCSHNQLAAATGRVMGAVPQVSPVGLTLLARAAKDIAAEIPHIAEQDIDIMPNSYTGIKKQRYLDAMESLLIRPLVPSDAIVTMFVKAERINGDEKRNPDPRAIQFRDPKYAVAFAQYLKPIEHWIYLIDFISKGVTPSRNVAKGLNNLERAKLLKFKMDEFDDPVVISVDASRFDKHVHIMALMLVHFIYLSANTDVEFARILAMQLVSTVYSDLGMKYIVYGKRMSGDMDTAAGNCLLMVLMVLTYCEYVVRLNKYDCIDDGDDCLLLIERADYAIFESHLQTAFLHFGHELKIENVTDNLFNVEFCQSQVIEYRPAEFKFVRNFRAVIAKSLCGIRNWKSPTYRIKVLRAIGSCELVLGLGVPILEEYALAILRNLPTGVVDFKYAPSNVAYRYKKEMKSLGHIDIMSRIRQIQDCARESFAQAYGVSIPMQLEIESALRSWTFDVRSSNFVGDEWDVPNWERDHRLYEVYDIMVNAKEEC